MNVQAYLKGCKRGEFTWECTESYGDGSAVDTEETSLDGRCAVIRRISSDLFEAEVTLKNNPVYDEREFASRLAARKWCERMIRKDIKSL